MNKYLVIGRYEGKKVKEKVEASRKRQAKLKAGFKSGFGGIKMRGFMASNDIKVRRVK